MKIKVFYYSLSGNNAKLAKIIAGEIGAETVEIKELRKRTWFTISLDQLFKRKTAKVNPNPNDALADCDLAILMGPVWMGKIALPLVPYLDYLKTISVPFAFVSVAGGAMGPNTGIAAELKEKTGREPKALVDMYVASLLPQEPKPEVKDTIKYKLTEDDLDKFASVTVGKLRELSLI
jgi:hypothetical protein